MSENQNQLLDEIKSLKGDVSNLTKIVKTLMNNIKILRDDHKLIVKNQKKNIRKN